MKAKLDLGSRCMYSELSFSKRVRHTDLENKRKLTRQKDLESKLTDKGKMLGVMKMYQTLALKL